MTAKPIDAERAGQALLPWAMRERAAGRKVQLKRRHWEIGSADGSGIAIVFGDHDSNARLIVRAVNVHAKMAAALRGMIGTFDECVRAGQIKYQKGSSVDEAITIARAALALAEGRTE